VLQRSPTAWSTAVVDATKAALKHPRRLLADARQLMACTGLILSCLAVSGRSAAAALTW
jgi:hypothetical protein